jgi:hypothetical protein
MIYEARSITATVSGVTVEPFAVLTIDYQWQEGSFLGAFVAFYNRRIHKKYQTTAYLW